MPLKKAIRPRKSPRLKKKIKTTPWMKFTQQVRENASVAIPLAAICILGAVMIIAAQEPLPSSTASAGALSERPAAEAPARSANPLADPEPASAGTLASDAKAFDARTAHVTITGCLERDNEAFRLKDTSGDDAPKARNWRWGFLKKGPASVQVVDGASSVRLRDHVGQRVTVSGMLADREMQVRSLQRVAPSCGAPRVKI